MGDDSSAAGEEGPFHVEAPSDDVTAPNYAAPEEAASDDLVSACDEESASLMHMLEYLQQMYDWAMQDSDIDKRLASSLKAR